MFEGVECIKINDLAIFSTDKRHNPMLFYRKEHGGALIVMTKLRLKEHRERLKLSHQELSQKSGVARGYIIELEENKYHPTIDVACKLCRAMDIGINELVDCECDEPV